MMLMAQLQTERWPGRDWGGVSGLTRLSLTCLGVAWQLHPPWPPVPGNFTSLSWPFSCLSSDPDSQIPPPWVGMGGGVRGRALPRALMQPQCLPGLDPAPARPSPCCFPFSFLASSCASRGPLEWGKGRARGVSWAGRGGGGEGSRSGPGPCLSSPQRSCHSQSSP